MTDRKAFYFGGTFDELGDAIRDESKEPSITDLARIAVGRAPIRDDSEPEIPVSEFEGDIQRDDELDSIVEELEAKYGADFFADEMDGLHEPLEPLDDADSWALWDRWREMHGLPRGSEIEEEEDEEAAEARWAEWDEDTDPGVEDEDEDEEEEEEEEEEEAAAEDQPTAIFRHIRHRGFHSQKGGHSGEQVIATLCFIPIHMDGVMTGITLVGIAVPAPGTMGNRSWGRIISEGRARRQRMPAKKGTPRTSWCFTTGDAMQFYYDVKTNLYRIDRSESITKTVAAMARRLNELNVDPEAPDAKPDPTPPKTVRPLPIFNEHTGVWEAVDDEFWTELKKEERPLETD